MKTVVLNDTRGCWHSGSDAVMDVLDRLLAEAGCEVIGRMKCGETVPPTEMKVADFVICNGEGTLHHGNGEHLMHALRNAQMRNKRTALVNALWQPTHKYWHDGVCAHANLFVVRDPKSKEAAHWMTPKLYPDLSIDAYTAMPPRSKNLGVYFGGGRGAWFRAAKTGYGTKSLWDEDFKWIVLELNHYAACYVTGEHHGLYAAILAGVPFVAVPGNSWKIEALVDWFGWGTVAHNAEEVQAGIEKALDTRKEYLEARERFLALPRMTAQDIKEIMG